jgi:hypothetical protein
MKRFIRKGQVLPFDDGSVNNSLTLQTLRSVKNFQGSSISDAKRQICP